MNGMNGMVMVPVITPYGTQLMPMAMNQLMAMNNQTATQQPKKNSVTAAQQHQAAQQQLQQLQLQQQLQVQAQLIQKQQNALLGQTAGNNAANNNTIVNSILQQQAQLLLNQQKLDEVKKLAKAAKMAAKSGSKSGSSSGASSVGSKGCLGTIGDLRSKYRSGTSSGFSSGSTDPSDSDGSSGISNSRAHYKNNFKLTKSMKNDSAQQHPSSSSNLTSSSGWSCDSGDDGSAGNSKFNIKLNEQRSGSKAAFLTKMVEVLESYFNDEGLKRNQFLMKQIQSSPEGIPLKKIASMRRVKVLTRDLLTVASAVRRSTLLELSRDGSLVKRVTKPSCLEPPKPIQTVLAINLETDTPTVESITGLFSKYGELNQIRIIRPTSSLPTYLKEFTMWVPDLGVNHCAVIEFETQEQAQAACREINMINRADGKLRVALLKPGARIRRTLYRKYKEDEDNKPEEKKEKSQKKQKTSQLTLKVFNSKLTQLDSGNGSDGSAEVSHSSEDELPRPTQNKTAARRWGMSTTRDLLQVVRQPTGPDGSRGFAIKRNIN